MLRVRFSVVVAVLAIAFSVVGGMAVIAATQSSDEEALQPARPPADRSIEKKVNALVGQMTLEEKLEQIQLLPDFMVTDDEVRAGLGSVLSQTNPTEIRRLQT